LSHVARYQCVKWLGLIWLDPPTQIKSSQNQANQIILNYNQR
jgi:hypothetical protein